MWTRRTWHECASELESVSSQFRSAYTNDPRFDSTRRDAVMSDSSIRGVGLLRMLALAIRSEQDTGLILKLPVVVGAINESATQEDLMFMPSRYRPPYNKMKKYKPLKLRDALNKIAHADPDCSGFFADERTHDLVLCGKNQERYWVAVISLIDLCMVIKCIPDRPIKSSNG